MTDEARRLKSLGTTHYESEAERDAALSLPSPTPVPESAPR